MRAAHFIPGLAIPALLSCASPQDTSRPFGALAISLTTTGLAPDPDGYRLLVGLRNFTVQPRDTLIISDLVPGTVQFTLSDLAGNCLPDPSNPASAMVRADDTTSVDLSVACPATTGELRLFVTTGGLEPDTDGYVISVGDRDPIPAAFNDTLVIGALDPGSYDIRLTGMDRSCAVVRQASPIRIDADVETDAALRIHCGWLLVYADGALRRVTTDGLYETVLTGQIPFPDFPQFSRDGRFITFSSYLQGNNEVFLMASDGTGLVQVTHDPGVDWSPTFTPDGTGLVFATSRGGYEWPRLHSMNLDGTDLRPLVTDTVRDGNPRFSPDGGTIAFTGNAATGVNAICRMAADGSDRRQLTSDTAHADVPTWSPDGRHLVFGSLRNGNYEIYRIDADGSNERQLTTFPGNPNFIPIWSPGGQYIVFTRQLNDQGVVRTVYVMNADGTGMHQILTNYQYVTAYDWQPR